MSSMEMHDRSTPGPNQKALLDMLMGKPDPRPRCTAQTKNYRSVELDVWEPFPCNNILTPYGDCPAISAHISAAELLTDSTLQPAPQPNNTASMHDLVIADMTERKAFGYAKYGTTLQAHNGRDPLIDAYQEVLDLAVYLRQAIEERGTTTSQSTTQEASTA